LIGLGCLVDSLGCINFNFAERLCEDKIGKLSEVLNGFELCGWPVDSKQREHVQNKFGKQVLELTSLFAQLLHFSHQLHFDILLLLQVLLKLSILFHVVFQSFGYVVNFIGRGLFEVSQVFVFLCNYDSHLLL